MTDSTNPTDLIKYLELEIIRHKNMSIYNNNKTSPVLLLDLLLIMIECNYTVATEVGTGDPKSPESRIVELLLQHSYITKDTVLTNTPTNLSTSNSLNSFENNNSLPINHSNINQSHLNNHPSTSSSLGGTENMIGGKESILAIQDLLLRGKREAAATMAARDGHWPLALIISGVCGKDTYQNIVRSYADKHIGQDSSNNDQQKSLHLLCLLYSNQVEGILSYGGKQLNANKIYTDPHQHSS